MEIKLSRIIINGFKDKEKKIDIEFSDNQTTIIFGSNGCGKTTFLKLLNGIFSRNNEILDQEKVEEINIAYKVIKHDLVTNEVPYLNKNVIIKRNATYSNEILVLEGSENELVKIEKYDWNDFDKSKLNNTSSLSLGIERGITNRSIQVKSRDVMVFLGKSPISRRKLPPHERQQLSKDLSHYLNRINVRKKAYTEENEISDTDHANLQNIELNNIEHLLLEKYHNARSIATERIQNALFKTLSFIFNKTSLAHLTKKPEITDDFSRKLLQNKDRIIEALDGGWDSNQFREETIEILKSINNNDDVILRIENQILFDLINNMMIQLEIERLLLSSISTFTEHFNDFLVDNKKLVIKSDEVYIDINGNHYGMDVLSSGERHIFTFLSLIITEGSNRDFIFIDEPEISLNIDWQRKIMRLLEEIAPKTQLIVASHSPMIANGMEDSLVELAPSLGNLTFDESKILENAAHNNLLTRKFNV